MPTLSPSERLAVAEIERRRGFLRRAPEATLGRELEKAGREARAAARRETSLQLAWRHTAPADVAAKGQAVSYRGGTLTLRVEDQAGKYLVDRWIKGAGRAAMVAALNAAVTRVVIRVGRSQASPGAVRRAR